MQGSFRRHLPAFSIYPKLVLCFLLVIVPIYAISFMMNQSSKQLVEKQLSQAVQSQVHFYRSSLDTEISRLNQLKAEYANDSDFQRLATAANLMNDFERVQAILSVKNKLHLLKSSTPFVENVKVYIPLLDRSIIANDLNDRIPADEMQALLNPASMQTLIFRFDNRLLISQLYPGVVRPGQQPILALEIELSRSKLKEMLSGIVQSNDGHAVIWNADSDWYVADGPLGPLESELRQLAARNANLGTDVRERPGSGSVNVNGKNYFASYEYSPVTNTYLAVYMPTEQVLSPITRYSRWLLLLSVISLALVALFSFSIHRVIHRPLGLLVDAFRKVERGDLGVAVKHRWRDEFHYLYGQFNQMVARIRVLIQEVYEQQILSQRSELKQLQSQINPHFLFNSFFILKGLVRRGEQELSLRMLDSLGEYFRFITRTGQEEVTLESELAHVKSYLDIQNMRFAGSIETHCEPLPSGWKDVLVPRLILQPLVENAYKHGLEDKVSGGKLAIRFETEAGGLAIVVEDNGDSLSDERLQALARSLRDVGRAKETTGILNVHRRMMLTSGGECGIEAARSPLGGLRIRLTIPKRRENEHVSSTDRG